MMKRLELLAVISLLISPAAALARDDKSTGTMPATTATAADKQLTPQQQKMGDCNKQASDKALKGDQRKAFMKTCLSASPASAGTPAAESPQDRMKRCNKEATDQGLKEDARKAFLSNCLKKK